MKCLLYSKKYKLKRIKSTSSIEEAALSFANMARGGWYVSPDNETKKSSITIQFLHSIQTPPIRNFAIL